MIKNSIKLSAEFKAQTTKSIIAIAFFALTYILMLVLAVGLTVLCLYAGFMLVVAKPIFITLALGIGLGSLGIMVLIFLLKFLFTSNKVDRSHLTEITKIEEPRLFDLIDDIVTKVGTSFPKKVYLSSDVNASVFYDSSFWSMFLPIKKNLQIGLGLVNTVSEAELTAILSHEFGHFSQRTMKVGSYVYNVNQVIFNLLYDNDSYDKLVQRWASFSGYFSIFVIAAVKIISGVQWILKKMYSVVNKSYMGLSREMEFHADAIAASVTGYQPLKSSLLRLSLADHAYNSVLSFYGGKISKNQKSENIYKEHTFVMNYLAKDRNITIHNNLPQITSEELNKFNKSRLVIKDQWASHPTTEDRIAMLEKLGLSAEQKEVVPAQNIFKNIEATQKELTLKTFKDVQFVGETKSIPFNEFQQEYHMEFLASSFSKVYNSYYDNKNPIPFDTNAKTHSENKIKLNDLYSDDRIDEVYTAVALQSDIETIKQIDEKLIEVRTFDYNGKKYKLKNCKDLLLKLDSELTEINDKIKQNDIRIFNFFMQLEAEQNRSPILLNLYDRFFEYDKEYDSYYEIYIKLNNELQFINFTTPFEQIRANFTKIKPLEFELKSSITKLLNDSKYKDEINKDIKENFELYLSDDWEYFARENYLDRNLETLFTALNNYAFLLSRGYFLLKKELLDYQDELLTPKN